MSTKSNDQGRAYEFAWMNVLNHRLSQIRNVKVIDNSSYLANEKSWNLIPSEQQKLFVTSAQAAVDTIMALEPIMVEVDHDQVTLEFQKDGAGIAGDVRDIVIKREEINWEFGLSIKHNHEAIKHSRLSYKIDFANEWFGIPCSEEYWKAVRPIFNMLEVEKAKGTKWSALSNKEDDVYVPLLQAFMNEVQQAYRANKDVPRKMVEYLIGICDYYKVVSIDNKRLTLVHTFNLHGTLNQSSSDHEPSFFVPVVELPTEIICARFKPKSKNTVELYLDNGWELSFRIHSASTIVEKSLKFDIQFIGMPISVLSINCQWH